MRNRKLLFVSPNALGGVRANRRALVTAAGGALLGSRLAFPRTMQAAESLAPAAERLNGMLRYLPDTLANRRALLQMASWYDYEKQRAALVREDGSEPDGRQATFTLPPIEGAAYFVDHEDLDPFRESFNQMVSIGLPPTRSVVFHVSDTEPVKAWLQSLPYQEIRELPEFTMFWHESLDLRNGIMPDNQRVVVFNDGPVILLPSVEDIKAFPTWWDEGGTSLADLQLGTEFTRLPEQTVSADWLPPTVLNRTAAVNVILFEPEHFAEIQDLSRQEVELFGSMPMPLRFWSSADAGVNTGNIRQETGPWEVVPPYEVPKVRAYVQFDSADSAEKAAPILEWRWQNMPSMLTGQYDLDDVFGYESTTQLPDDPTVVMQEFDGGRRPDAIMRMVSAGDLVIYGWGDFPSI